MEALMTVKEFCTFARMSDSTWFKLQREKAGPKVVRIGGRVLITPEAAREWIAKMEKAA